MTDTQTDATGAVRQLDTGTTVPMPSEAVRLNRDFDAAALLAELESARQHTWEQQRVYGESGVGRATDVDWRCLALRSPGGDGARTDPGGPGPHDFADTPWAERMPYVREVLAAIPAQLHAVRFMALGPDTVGMDHNDPKYGPRWGVTRLHVPLVTSDDAVLVLDGVTHRWQPGEFWFGDFSRTHRVANTGTEPRVHLVIDALVTPELTKLFPEQWSSYFAGGDVVYNRHRRPQSVADREAYRCTFDLPAEFTQWEEQHPLDAGRAQPVQALATGDDLALALPSGQTYALVHLGCGEYRLAGWSEERTLQFFLDGDDPQVVLCLREGRSVSHLSMPVLSVGSQ